MPAESSHHPSGSLRLAAVLAAAAGFVDAFFYLRVAPVFVANMSGNLIRLGIATGVTDWNAVGGSAAALGGFVAGVIMATTHLDAQLRRQRHPHPSTLLLFEAIVLAALALALVLTHHHDASLVRSGDYPFIVLGATAMGAQAAAVRRVGEVAVSTTYGTGAVVRLGEKAVLALRRSIKVGEHRRRVTIVVLCTVLVGYVAGAAVAASVGGGSAYLFVPASVIAAAAALIDRRRP